MNIFGDDVALYSIQPFVSQCKVGNKQKTYVLTREQKKVESKSVRNSLISFFLLQIFKIAREPQCEQNHNI